MLLPLNFFKCLLIVCVNNVLNPGHVEMRGIVHFQIFIGLNPIFVPGRFRSCTIVIRFTAEELENTSGLCSRARQGKRGSTGGISYTRVSHVNRQLQLHTHTLNVCVGV